MADLTAKEFIEINLKKHNVPFTDGEIRVLFAELESDPTVSAETPEGLNIARKGLVSMLTALLLNPNVTEGGYSISWNYDSILTYLNMLNNKLGLPLFGESILIDSTDTW